MPELSARARQVLYHCVTEYVATGEPVGSRTLSKKAALELSPASIRNVLADLEDSGYLSQPHTSAGRIPTVLAFRLFIDALMQMDVLTHTEEATIKDRFLSFEPGQNMIRETGKLLSELTGTAARATISAIVRDFDDDELERHLALLRRTAEEIVATEPRARLGIEVTRQYPNMRRFIDAVPYVTEAAEAAIRAEGIEPVRTAIRGGTDGSKLSARGLPTPNLFTGGHEYHSVREWASLQDMAAAAATIVRLAEVWTRPEFAAAASRPAGRAVP